MDEADALEALANILTSLTNDPYDLSLHSQHVRLARETEMEDQLEAALDMVTTFWAAGDYVWEPLVDMKMKNENLETVEGLQTVFSFFERAEEDYLSIVVLQKHLELILERHEHFKEQGSRPQEFGDLLSTEWIHSQMSQIVARGRGHISESHKLWDLQRDFELELLAEASDAEKPELASRVETLLLERLKEPHSNSDETLQAYSTFTTNHKSPDEYEQLLVQASKSRSQAVKAYQRREKSEASLAQASFSLDAYAYYIASERKAKKPDTFVLGTLYERAIAEADKRRWNGEAIAEEALRSFWAGYLDLQQDGFDEDVRMQTFKRAIRSIPGSGEIWARYLRFLERTENFDLVDAAYNDALSSSLIAKDPEQLVPVILAKAGYDRRAIEREMQNGMTDSEEGFENVVKTLMEGIGKVRKASKAGDPRLRLEKCLSSMCTEVAGMAEHAVIMWEDASKHCKTSYLAWTAYTDVLIKQHLFDDARKVFRDVANKNLDWPEAVWEAWVAFEHVHGSLDELEDCMARIQTAQTRVNAKRAKEAEKAIYEAMQTAAEQQANVPVAQAPAPSAAQQEEDVAMQVDTVQHGEGSSKRKAEDEAAPEGVKKARVENSPAPLKRDRENCTVFVADLPTGTSEDDLRALFKDCGPVRDVKITVMPNNVVATVEFMERDSVPAALTKDKKRIHDEEIAVHIAWQSTLYVTNFPENADDKYIRDLFGKYGLLFDVRWPSKKFKSTRRFCYVQFVSPTTAKAALGLHDFELEPGRRLTVYISDPGRKKDRTDSDANDREVYVAGLSRSVNKGDLQKLFSTYGTVKEVRMALDDKGLPKGFAFVEFEQEKDALAALSANNHELKKRRIAVTLADTRAKSSKATFTRKRPAEVVNRSVRVRGLPAGTQEGLLQQALEKIVKVQRVEVFEDKHEAVAELETPAEAGKLLLHPEPVDFNGSVLQFSEESLASTTATTKPTAPVKGLFIPRSAASRPRAGLGSKRTQGLAVSNPAASSSGASSTTAPSGPATTSAKGQDDFRKMLGL